MEHKRRKKLWIIPVAVLVILAIGVTGVLFIRQEIRAARQREAEEFKFTSASLAVDRSITAPGEPVTFTASAGGGKGTLLYEFYYMDGEEKVVLQAPSEENTFSFTADGYQLYEIFVEVSDESAMTGNITASCRYGAAHSGIDASVYQRDIDWAKVKAAGYDFAMLRTGFGKEASQKDQKFDQNILAASMAGLKVGAYHFSYALTPEDAKKEAELCLSILEPYRSLIDYPIAFDIEGEEQQGLSEEELTAIVEAFCSVIAEAGYTPIIYTYDSWLVSHPGWGELQHYDIWAANWAGEPRSAYEYIIWQYSNQGKVDGVAGNVDLNYAFCDYEGGKKIS